MADLRTHSAGMHELLGHLREREGAIEHFYCDHRGLVTIAIGYLVDRGDVQGDHHGRQLAKELSERSDVIFRRPDHTVASESEVEADWQRVKAHGREHAGIGARQYGAVARLRIDLAGIDAITSTVVRRFLDDLYDRKPFLLSHDVHVAMALIDARYNPAGVKLYGDDPEMQALWHALDPARGPLDNARAAELFAHPWKDRGNDRYRMRHAQRVAWLHAGLAAPAEAVAASPESSA